MHADNSNKIREMFLDFFKNHGHKIIAGSSLIPKEDSSLLFTNSGMNQFKKAFLGEEEPLHSRVATIQNCIRAGGKHNDLENVGYTEYHHTFFEMLGNFSFNDYFKRESIQFAWELLTGSNWFNLSKKRMLVTVHKVDEETYGIWKNEIGLPENQILLIDTNSDPFLSENFWKMGKTGPCGPCSEIFYDISKNDKNYSGKLGKLHDRYTEIWNLVFIQFNLHINGTFSPLSKLSVDTGMGLERISAILQGVSSVYETDLFKEIISFSSQIVSVKDTRNISLRIICDHIRSCVFIINEGILPSNDGRGYVLRRIIRRAVRHGQKLGMKSSFFYRLVQPFIEITNNAENQLERRKKMIEDVIRSEEEQFSEILKRGMKILKKELTRNFGNILDGRIVFRLYDTHGFPPDLTEEICKEKNIGIDRTSFEELMEIQRKKSKTDF